MDAELVDLVIINTHEVATKDSILYRVPDNHILSLDKLIITNTHRYASKFFLHIVPAVRNEKPDKGNALLYNYPVTGSFWRGSKATILDLSTLINPSKFVYIRSNRNNALVVHLTARLFEFESI